MTPTGTRDPEGAPVSIFDAFLFLPPIRLGSAGPEAAAEPIGRAAQDAARARTFAAAGTHPPRARPARPRPREPRQPKNPARSPRPATATPTRKAPQ